MRLRAARLMAVNLTLVFLVTQPDSVCLCLFPRVVKEEISDDNAKLPCFNGRVVSWVSEMDGAAPARLQTKICAALVARVIAAVLTPPHRFSNPLNLDLTIV